MGTVKLVSSDIIKVDKSGVTVTLVKGKNSEIKFVNPRTGEKIKLSYNPSEQKTQTVNQRPDNVLSLEKRGTDVEYKYVFDAKYRIETNTDDPFYPDTAPGPKVDDINTMHRYRDSIVYENHTPSRFMFEKTMFGAYILFPYDDPEKDYVNHRFYKSIEKVNIGGLPFLPGTTDLVEKFLQELISDSKESAFERSTLPRGIEEKLMKVDWSLRDVMLGTVRTSEQLKYNIENNCYYVPKHVLDSKDLPIHFIALNEKAESGRIIQWYGKVITTTIVKRHQVPTPTNPNKLNNDYYFFKIQKWIKLKEAIPIFNTDSGKPLFTNKFLLDHCKKSYQLFTIHSESDYRLMLELEQAFDNVDFSKDNRDDFVYQIDGHHSLLVNADKYAIMNSDGTVSYEVYAKEFAKQPKFVFEKIRESIQDK